jgi:hypothetical protein
VFFAECKLATKVGKECRPSAKIEHDISGCLPAHEASLQGCTYQALILPKFILQVRFTKITLNTFEINNKILHLQSKLSQSLFLLFAFLIERKLCCLNTVQSLLTCNKR